MNHIKHEIDRRYKHKQKERSYHCLRVVRVFMNKGSCSEGILIMICGVVVITSNNSKMGALNFKIKYNIKKKWKRLQKDKCKHHTTKCNDNNELQQTTKHQET